ncbi:MAG TPA: pilus assembly protein TadG-related protein [Tepidisphaeraceae bacterium]|nr:pilus assembly protein TadG-related protein [Tepidisphaeraceae bacterium]
MIYTIVALVALLGVCTLGLDYGKAVLAKTELRAAADAVARATADSIDTGIAAAKNVAVATGAANTCDGTAVAIDPAVDVEFGTFDDETGVFTVLTGSSQSGATAVRVTARRTAARGNPIGMILGGAIGLVSCDVTAQAVATAPIYGYGMIGLNYIKMSGNATASYRSGGSGNSNGNRGSIASNGDITLSGTTAVGGDARPGIGRTVYGAAGRVAGSTAPLTATLVCPPESAATYSSTNDNALLPSGALDNQNDLVIKNNQVVTLPGGVYYVRDLNIFGSGTLAFTGKATLVCYGSVTLSGKADTHGDIPGNLKIIVVANQWNNVGSVNIGSQSALRASIYAPQSAISLSGGGSIYGNLVGLSIDMTGTSDVYYDLALNANSGVRLVK